MTAEPFMRSMLRVAALCVAMFAMLLAVGCQASGRADRVTPHHFAPQPPEAVEMYFDGRMPTARYHTIANVESEATTRRFVTLAEAEAAAIDRLRHLAARHGATAVIEIETEVLRDGEVIDEVPRATQPLRDTGHVVRATGRAIRIR